MKRKPGNANKKKEIPVMLKKTILIILGCVFLVLCVGYITFKIVFSPERLKNSFQASAERVFNRRVEIATAHLDPGKLILRDIKIYFTEEERVDITKRKSSNAIIKQKPSNAIIKQKPSNAEKIQNFIFCEKAEIGFKLLPILKNKFVFKDISVNSPVINFIGKPQIIIANLIKRGIRSDLHSHFEIRKFKIKDGTIKFLETDIVIKNIDLKVKEIIHDELVMVELGCELKNSNVEYVELAGKIDILKNEGKIESLKISGSGGEVIIDGKIKDIITFPYLSLNYNVVKFPYRLLPAEFEIAGDYIFRGKIEDRSDKLNISWQVDLSGTKINYPDVYLKPQGSILRFKGGLTLAGRDVAIDWYVLEKAGLSVSGTGNIGNGQDVHINIISEDVNLKRISKNFNFIGKYIDSGLLSIRGIISSDAGRLRFSGTLDLQELKIKNFKGLANLYRKITGIDKETINMKDVKADILLDRKRITVNKLTASGGDISGSGKGYYNWGEDMNFILYPKIFGRKLMVRVGGDKDNIRIDLK